MAYKLEFHPEAEAEFDDALAWYQQESPGLEQAFFDEYLVLENRIAKNPREFPLVIEDIRRANFLKDIAKELLERLKEKEFKIIHWADKEQTASAVKVVIKNYLFDKLPFPAYEEADIEVRTEVLFEFFKGRYAVGMAA